MPGAALPSGVGKPAVAFPYPFNAPTDALITLKDQSSLGRFIAVWGLLNAFNAFIGLRIGAISQRWSACRCDVRQVCRQPDVVRYLADVGAVCDEGDDAHLPATDGTQKREHLIDSGDQRRPENVRLAFGRCGSWSVIKKRTSHHAHGICCGVFW